MSRRAFVVMAWVLGISHLHAQPATPSGIASDKNSDTNPAVALSTNVPASTGLDLKEVSPGIFEYHGVRLDKKNHRISFPATVNQRVGLIEYLLVNEMGKVHESLFSTKILPRDIHLSLLLIGLKEDPKSNAKDPAPPSAINMAYLQSAPKLKGPSVELSVAWQEGGSQKEVQAEDCILNLQTNHAMTRGPWTYNGSMVENGVFVADQELSIVAVITDPTALVNNPREGYDNDEIWQVQEKAVPPLDTPVELTITLAEPITKNP